MKIKFVENVSAVCGSFRLGQWAEVPEDFARDMIRAKYAVPVDGQQPKPEAKAEAKPEAKKPEPKKAEAKKVEVKAEPKGK